MTQPKLTGQQIKKIRELAQYTRSEFATVCGRTSNNDDGKASNRLRDLVIAWEEETKKPSTAVMRIMLYILAERLTPTKAYEIECLLQNPSWDGALPIIQEIE